MLPAVEGGVHGQQPPAGGPAQREEEQQADPAQEGVGAVGLQAAVDLQVGQREGLRVGTTLEWDPGATTHAACGTVTADQVAGAHLLRAPVGVAQGAADTVGIGVEGDQLHPPLDVDAVAGQVAVQHRLCLGLGDEQQEGIGGVVEAEPEQPHPDGAVAGVELDPDRVVAARQQLLGHTQPAQHLKGARLDGQRSRFVDAVGLPVDDAGAGPERLELGGQREAGRPGADDQYVKPLAVGGCHVRVARAARQRRAARPAAVSR